MIGQRVSGSIWGTILLLILAAVSPQPGRADTAVPGSDEPAPAESSAAVRAEPGAAGPADAEPADKTRLILGVLKDLVARAEVAAALDSVRFRPENGRPRESFPVRHDSDGAYLSLGDFGRITGGGYRWNPETWKGSLRLDSLEVGFALDTPVFWVRNQAIQLPAPVRIAEEQVWLPLVLLDGILQ